MCLLDMFVANLSADVQPNHEHMKGGMPCHCWSLRPEDTGDSRSDERLDS